MRNNFKKKSPSFKERKGKSYLAEIPCKQTTKSDGFGHNVNKLNISQMCSSFGININMMKLLSGMLLYGNNMGTYMESSKSLSVAEGMQLLDDWLLLLLQTAIGGVSNSGLRTLAEISIKQT